MHLSRLATLLGIACGCSTARPAATADATAAADARATDGVAADTAHGADGALPPDMSPPDAVHDSLPASPVVQLAAGLQHTCALMQSGAVRCWGSNEFGQLGYPGVTDVGLANLPSAA